MCFDICTINVRVSIRVRGLHLVLYQQKTQTNVRVGVNVRYLYMCIELYIYIMYLLYIYTYYYIYNASNVSINMGIRWYKSKLGSPIIRWSHKARKFDSPSMYKVALYEKNVASKSSKCGFQKTKRVVWMGYNWDMMGITIKPTTKWGLQTIAKLVQNSNNYSLQYL